jgi:hypothetical protein
MLLVPSFCPSHVAVHSHFRGLLSNFRRVNITLSHRWASLGVVRSPHAAAHWHTLGPPLPHFASCGCMLTHDGERFRCSRIALRTRMTRRYSSLSSMSATRRTHSRDGSTTHLPCVPHTHQCWRTPFCPIEVRTHTWSRPQQLPFLCLMRVRSRTK